MFNWSVLSLLNVHVYCIDNNLMFRMCNLNFVKHRSKYIYLFIICCNYFENIFECIQTL